METTQRPRARGATLRRIAWPRDAERRIRMGARWLSLTLLALALGIAATVVLLRPPAAHVRELALALALAGAGALALGEVALRATSAARLGSVRVKLAIPPLLTALVIAFTVLALANAMFISPQDSMLLLVFLGFGVLVALTLAGTLAGEIARSIARVETGARRIAQGDYAFRVPERDGARTGTGELEQLARWFNTMAANVEDAFARRDRAETDRRRVLAALSHDLRTPLASVRAMIEAIDDGVAADDETVRRYHRAIRAEVDRLSLLLDELFELSRLESGALVLQRERLGIEDLISDALEAFHEQAAQAGVRLEGSVDEGLAPVTLDPRQIARALGNLVQNALRYTPTGGAVVIRARESEASGVVEGTGRRELVVQVLDSGSGIDPADLAHIFEHAYRGDPSRARSAAWAEQHGCGGGAGLGLTIARGIVELHGGRMWAESPLPAELRAQLAPLLPAAAPPYLGAALAFTVPLIPAATAQ